MGNVLKAHKKTEILTLVRAEHSFRDVGKRLDVRRETVSKYAKEAGLWPPSKPATGPEVATGFCGPIQETSGAASNFSDAASIPKQARSACAPWHDWIVGEVQKGRNAVSIYQDLVERFGFSNRYNSVKRYVKGLKRVDPERYDRLEFLPGEEAQVDYGQGALTRYNLKPDHRRLGQMFGI